MNAKVILVLAGVGLLNFGTQGAKPESLEAAWTTARTTPAFPLKLSADRRYLIDQHDQPFLVIGDSPWSLIVEPTPAQVDLYLDDRAAKGFNLLLVNLLEHKFSTQPPKLRDGTPPFAITAISPGPTNPTSATRRKSHAKPRGEGSRCYCARPTSATEVGTRASSRSCPVVGRTKCAPTDAMSANAFAITRT
jgi:hypothetical protein